MELVTPDIGLLFWMLLSFCIVLVILKKFAWKPILAALKSREDSIEEALSNAMKAREEIANLKNEKDKILNTANREREKILEEAKEDADEYRKTQRQKTDEQFRSKIDSAIDEINQQKRLAMNELKDVVGNLSIEIAEKILEKELDNPNEHDQMIKKSIDKLEIK